MCVCVWSVTESRCGLREGEGEQNPHQMRHGTRAWRRSAPGRATGVISLSESTPWVWPVLGVGSGDGIELGLCDTIFEGRLPQSR